jgi:hypothetical protein
MSVVCKASLDLLVRNRTRLGPYCVSMSVYFFIKKNQILLVCFQCNTIFVVEKARIELTLNR